ncbi:hypothetical protein T4D_17086 [Trichinella pseudospiralis]|uniref:Uncharacterized protein n=1 Tax=Trichinella pseudospiralis TaxID=6337 RepID=A0A0V1G459_TRIPS|nr:hypothetical protein T4D_17086 [Trichinella pseudospiralis]
MKNEIFPDTDRERLAAEGPLKRGEGTAHRCIGIEQQQQQQQQKQPQKQQQ